MRDLTADEKTIVAGGFWEEYEDEAGFIARLRAERQARADYICGGPLAFKEPSLEEVLIKAAKMTGQEKLAWDAAKARAEANLLLAETAIVGGSVFYGLGASKAVATLLSVLGFHAGTKYTAEERAAVLERMTEMEFEMDGMDGSHDGFVYYQSPLYGSP